MWNRFDFFCVDVVVAGLFCVLLDEVIETWVCWVVALSVARLCVLPLLRQQPPAGTGTVVCQAPQAHWPPTCSHDLADSLRQREERTPVRRCAASSSTTRASPSPARPAPMPVYSRRDGTRSSTRSPVPLRSGRPLTASPSCSPFRPSPSPLDTGSRQPYGSLARQPLSQNEASRPAASLTIPLSETHLAMLRRGGLDSQPEARTSVMTAATPVPVDALTGASVRRLAALVTSHGSRFPDAMQRPTTRRLSF